MPMQWRNVDIPVGGGRADKVDPLQIQPPSHPVIQNIRHDDAGVLVKRYGNDKKLADLGTTNPHTLYAHRGSIRCLTQAGIHQVGGEAAWRAVPEVVTNGERQPMVPLEVSTEDIAGDSLAAPCFDSAIDSVYKIRLEATTRRLPTGYPGELYARFVDDVTGRVIRGWERLGTARQVRAVACNGKFWLVVYAGSGLVCSSVTVTTGPVIGEWTSWFTIALGAPTGVSHFDACPAPNTGQMHVVYYGPTSGLIYVDRVNSTPAITQSTTWAGPALSTVTSVVEDDVNNRIWVAWSQQSTPAPQYRVLTSAYGVYLGTTTIATATGATITQIAVGKGNNVGGVGDALLTWREEYSAGGSAPADVRRHVNLKGMNDAGATTIAQHKWFHASIVAKPFLGPGARAVLPLRFAPDNLTTAADEQDGYYAGFLAVPYGGTADEIPGVVGRFMVDRCAGPNNENLTYSPTDTNRVSSTYLTASRPTQERQAWHFLAEGLHATGDWGRVTSVRVSQPVLPLKTLERAGVTYLTGAQLAASDGAAIYEAGHLVPCTQIRDYATPSTGGFMSDGTYGYRIVTVFKDAMGVEHRSPASPAHEVTLSGGTSTQKVDLIFNLPPACTEGGLIIGAASSPNEATSYFEIYRTEANGSVYHLAYRIQANGSTTGMETQADTISDAQLLAGNGVAPRFLFTTGGTLNHSPLPPVADMAWHGDRLLFLDADHRHQVGYSRFIQPELVPEFPAEFRVTFPEKLTAIASLGPTWYAFSAERIWAVSGDGPLDTGQQDTFSLPQMLPSDVGCIEPRSVLAAKGFGVVFRSRRGIELLTRSGAVEYIGAAVEDVLTPSPFSSVVHLPEQHEVRWTQAGESTVLVFNTLHKTWAVWTGFTDMEHGLEREGDYLWIDTGGSLFQETPGVYLDDQTGGIYPSIIPTTVELPWLRLAGKQGYFRVRKIQLSGVASATCVLTVNLYRDDNATTPFQTESIVVQDAVDPWTVEIRPATQKVRSIKIKLADASLLGVKGFTISLVTLQVGIKGGLLRLPVAQTQGGGMGEG